MAKALTQTTRGDIDALRDRIAELQAERARIEAEPVDQAEARARIEQFVASAGRHGRGMLEDHSFFAGENVPLGRELGGRVARDPFAVMCAAMPERMAELLLANHPGGGMAGDERAAKLAEIDDALFAAGIAEERAIREIEGYGASIPRRLDADAAIVLAPDADLDRAPKTGRKS